jgi:hypothetical protein
VLDRQADGSHRDDVRGKLARTLSLELTVRSFAFGVLLTC